MIIAIGSPFGDDRLAWLVADKLRVVLPQTVPIITLDRPGLSLLPYFEDAPSVLVIDAIHSNAALGTIHWLEGGQIPQFEQSTSSHGMGLKEAFQLAKTLEMLPEHLYFCGIEADLNWQDPDRLSPTTLKAMPALIDKIMAYM